MIFRSVILIALATTAYGGGFPWPGGMDQICANFHCAGQIAGCALDKGCIDDMLCAAKCPTPAHDKSPGKVDYQGCCLKCSYSYGYGNKANDDMMTCLNVNKCLTLPNINDPATDPFFNKCNWDNIKIKKHLTMEDLLGSEGWWAAIGFHPIYDCSWPCQYAVMTHTDSQNNLWDVRMQVPLVDNSLMEIHEGWPFPVQPGQTFWLNHTDLGMLHWEHWYLLDKAADGSWVSLYYCGGTAGWKYSGGILFSKERTLSNYMRSVIKESYLYTADLDIDTQGCTFDNSQCPYGPGQATTV